MDIAATSFLLGLLSTSSPCVLPLYPGFLAYLSAQTSTGVGRQRYLLGLDFLAGVLSTMLALGGLIALLAAPIGKSVSILRPLADAAILVLGILLIFDRNPFKSLPTIRVPLLRFPFLNAFVYGALYAPIALPCSGPLIVAIFAVSLTLGEAFSKLWVFLWFGLGFGTPLLVLSLLSGALARQLTGLFARHSRAINLLGGLLLVAIALFDLAQNVQMLRTLYA